jgi:hypothetical protein
VEITAALAADLAILTQALDEPDADIAATLRHLVVDAPHGGAFLLGTEGYCRQCLFWTELHGYGGSRSGLEVHASLMMPLDRLCPMRPVPASS